MTETSHTPLTAAVITFNSETYVHDCLQSLLDAGLAEAEILVVDDGSTDRTVLAVKDGFPGVRIIADGSNRGHSHACNRAISEAKTSWVVLIDHDTEVHPNWLTELRRGIDRQPGAAIVVARTVFDSDRETIHADGGFAHFLGNMTLLNGFAPMRGAGQEIVELGAAGTTSMAVNRDWALRVGGFDEAFFIYLNDFEFSLRVRLTGGRIFCAPLAVIYHKGGTPNVSFRGNEAYPPRRAYLILRNRWFLILKLYRIKTLILVLPALLLYESLLLAMVIQKGVWREYGRAWGWLAQHLLLVLDHRRQAQLLRRIGDRELLSGKSLTFVPGVVRNPLIKFGKSVLDSGFSAYWQIINRIL